MTNNVYGYTTFAYSDNTMQDLARLESGGETSFNEPFNLRETITDAIQLYKYVLFPFSLFLLDFSDPGPIYLCGWNRNEAKRRNIDFDLDLSGSPHVVIGDAKKIRTVVANLTANAGKCFTPRPFEQTIIF